MRDDLIETYNIINRLLIMVDFFLIFFFELEIYCQKITVMSSEKGIK